MIPSRWSHSLKLLLGSPRTCAACSTAAASDCSTSYNTCSAPSQHARHNHTGSYQVEVAIKAFEPAYLKHAAATIRDLLLINFAPKGPSALSGVAASATTTPPSSSSTATLPPFRRRAAGPVGKRGPPGSGASVTVLPSGTRLPRTGKLAQALAAAAAAPTHLVMPPAEALDVPLDWKKTRFTVIRGPHVDKRGMEQFETRKYKALLNAVTNSSLEVRWFLDQLKMYDLTGVQVQVILTSNTYLTPAPAAHHHPVGAQGSGGLGQVPPALGGGGGGLLAAHRRRTAQPYLLPRSPAALPLQRQHAVAGLDLLRQAVRGGLEEQAAALAAARGGGSGDSGRPSAPAAAPRTHLLGSAESGGLAEDYSPHELQVQLRQRLQALRQGSNGGATANGGAGETVAAAAAAAAGRHGPAAAFLAAVDAVLLSVRFDALEGHQNFPFHFATLAPGLAPPPVGAQSDAQWMQCMLKYGQLVQKLGQYSQERQLMQAYVEYGRFSHALLYQLLSLWVAAAEREGRAALALPSQEQVLKTLHQQVVKHKEAPQPVALKLAGQARPRDALAASRAAALTGATGAAANVEGLGSAMQQGAAGGDALAEGGATAQAGVQGLELPSGVDSAAPLAEPGTSAAGLGLVDAPAPTGADGGSGGQQ